MKTSDHDPFAKAESLIREVHDSTHKHLRPVYRRYPLLFLLLLTFSAAATFHGLDDFLNQFAYLKENPLVLMGIGILGLFATGTLYKRLERG
jgi:hypothetical protein